MLAVVYYSLSTVIALGVSVPWLGRKGVSEVLVDWLWLSGVSVLLLG